MNEPVEGCPRCFIENRACLDHCDPATCDREDHVALHTCYLCGGTDPDGTATVDGAKRAVHEWCFLVDLDELEMG